MVSDTVYYIHHSPGVCRHLYMSLSELIAGPFRRLQGQTSMVLSNIENACLCPFPARKLVGIGIWADSHLF